MGGKFWGSLTHIRNVAFVRVSRYELNPFHNFFQKSAKGTIKFLEQNGIHIFINVLSLYTIINWANAENIRHHRKKPHEFDHEK